MGCLFIYMGVAKEEKIGGSGLFFSMQEILPYDVIPIHIATFPLDMPPDNLSNSVMDPKHMKYPLLGNTGLVGSVTITGLHGHKKKI